VSKTIILYCGSREIHFSAYANAICQSARVIIASEHPALDTSAFEASVEQVFLDRETDLTPDSLMSIYGTTHLINLSV